MDDKRQEAAQRLLDAAHDFWSECNKSGQYGAVQWLTGTLGELVLFTRGEYRRQLMDNIDRIAGTEEVYLFGEEMPEDADDE
jgi:hypothetical protein